MPQLSSIAPLDRFKQRCFSEKHHTITGQWSQMCHDIITLTVPNNCCPYRFWSIYHMYFIFGTWRRIKSWSGSIIEMTGLFNTQWKAKFLSPYQLSIEDSHIIKVIYFPFDIILLFFFQITDWIFAFHFMGFDMKSQQRKISRDASGRADFSFGFCCPE